MGSQKRFIKKIPSSGASSSFKLTLPHQVVHQYLLHLVDNDFELAGSPDAEQTWLARISPRRNKERSEFTLQGWRLFADAHKVQAGDQVAFELVNENRLVAQVIKHADGPQAPWAAPKASGVKHKFVTRARAPRRVFQRTAGDYMKALDDMPLPTNEEWGKFPEALSSAGESSYSHMDGFSQVDANGCVVPPSPSLKAKSQVVPDWAGDRLVHDNMTMELGYHDSRHSLDSTSGPIPRPRHGTTPTVVSELSFPAFMSPHDAPSSPMAYPDLLDDSINDFIMGDEPILHESLYSTEAASESQQTPVTPVSTSIPPPATADNPLKAQLEDLNTMVQSLQRQAHAAQSEAEEARQRCARMQSTLDSLQSDLRSHSRRALKAAMGLENCSATLAYTHNVPSDLTAWLGQLKDSLSQLLILATDDDHLAAHLHPSSCSNQETFDKFAMPL